MLLKKHFIFVLSLLIINSHALSCRSKYGPKDEELKRIFNNCQSQQEENSSNNRHTEQDRTERSYNYKNNFDRNSRNENSDEINSDRDSMRDEYGNDRSNSRSGREQLNDNKRTESERNNENRRNNRMSSNDREDRNRDRNEMNRNYNSHLSGQDDFLQSEEYPNQNYYSSPRPIGRYKREKKVETNSGKRSQYNPYSQKFNENKENHSNEANSSDNSSKTACVLNCLMENLQMTGDNGMPDRFLITHALTKDERNEDLRDFLQESIEECFQILDNENTEDKCEFSKKIWICLSEKGRANCDDWPKKTGFMF